MAMDTPRPWSSAPYVRLGAVDIDQGHSAHTTNMRQRAAREAEAMEAHALKAGRRFVRADLYYDLPGIPMPELGLWNFPSVFRYLISVFLLLGLLFGPVRLAARSQEVLLPAQGSSSIKLRNCNLLVKPAKPGAASTLRLQHWAFLGYGWALTRADGSVEARMEYSNRNKFFQCTAILGLQPDFVFNSLQVSADGETIVEQMVDAPKLQLKAGRFHVQKGQVFLTNLMPMGPVLISLHQGMAEIQLPSAPQSGGKLSIRSKEAAVALHSEHGFKVKADHRAALYTILRADTLDATFSDELQATVGPPGEAHDVQLSGKEAPFYLVSSHTPIAESWEVPLAKEWRGPAHKEAALLPGSLKELNETAEWVQNHQNFRVSIKALGPGMPKGVWEIISCKAYLVFSAEFFVLLSAGMLYPYTLELDVHLTGSDILSTEKEAKEEMEKEGAHDHNDGPAKGLRPFEELSTDEFAGGEGAKVMGQLEAAEESESIFQVFRLISSALGPKVASLMVWCPEHEDLEEDSMEHARCLVFEGGSDHQAVRARLPQFMDYAAFLMAVLLNLLGSTVFVVFAIRFLRDVALPWTWAEMRSDAIKESATQRLQYMGSEAAWRVFAVLVQSPEHGVLLRWTTKAEFQSVVDFRFFAEAVDQPHRVSFEVNRIHVGTLTGNPYQKEYFVPVWPSDDHKLIVHREPLRYQHTYKFRITALGDKRRVLLESLWTSPLQIDPPLTLSEFPFLLQKVFFPAKLSTMEIFAGDQITQKVLETKVALCRLYIDIDHKLHGRMEQNQEYGETVLLTISWVNADGSPFAEAEEQDPPIVVDMAESGWVRKSDVLSEEELASCSDAALYMRNAAPLTIVLTRTTGKQRHLSLKVASSTGMEYLYFRFSLQELMSRWEQQSQLCRDERHLEKRSRASRAAGEVQAPPSLLELGDLSRAQERLAQPWARDSHLTRNCDGGVTSFWVAMGDNDPYPNGPFRWQLFPTTPYRTPTENDAGKRVPGRLPWARCPVRNLWPSEMLLMGTEKLIEFDHEWVDEEGGRNDLTHTLDFALRPASGQGHLLPQFRTVADAVDASTKHTFTWRVPYEAKELDGRFIMVCRPHGGDGVWRQGSVEFFIDRPLLLQDFELAYAAWCRSYKLPMEEVNPSLLMEQGLAIVEEPLAAVQGVRAVFPMEQQENPDLELCSCAQAIFPCHRALVLEGRTTPCRTAIRHVQVLEGASWSGVPWGFNVMLLYNGDVSWSWSKSWTLKVCPTRLHASVRGPLRRCIHSVQDSLAWMFQLTFFLFMPTLALLLLCAQQYLHAEFNPTYREVTAKRHCMQLLTEKFFHREFWHVDDLDTKLRVPLSACVVWVCMMPVILGYMNFAKDALPWFHHIAAAIIKWLSLGSGLVFLLLASTTVLWMVLGALLDPMGLAPIAVMVGALLTISQTMLSYLFEQQQKVLKTVKALMEPLLVSQLDEFVRGRPDLRSEVEGGATAKGGAADPEKADFLRALCFLGTYIKPKGAQSASDAPQKAFSKSDLFASGGDEDEGEAKTVEAENWFGDEGVDVDAQNQLMSTTREKISIIYQYLLRHTPLRGGIGEALRDTKALAKLGYDAREQGLRRILDNGAAMVVGILENMLSVGLNGALVSILQANAESRINLVDREALSESIVVFFDHDLAGLISTHLQSSLDRKFDALIARAEAVFDLMDPQRMGGRERSALEKRVAAYDDERKRLQEEAADWKWPFDLPMVDATGDAVANISLLAMLQELGIIPPYSVYLMRDGGQSPYDMLSMLEPLLEEAYHWCELHVGSSVLRKHDVLTYIRSQIDSVGDGRVDQLWYSAFHELCEEIYLVGHDCPLTQQDVDNAWNGETPTRLLMDVTRVDDCILSSLMTDAESNEKKLWREAFCLLARSLHVWPEIPLDDAVVELVRVNRSPSPNGYRICSFVPTVTNVEVDAHGRLLKTADVTVKPNPPQLMETLVFSDRGFGFRSFGEFGPHSGFAFMQTPFRDLSFDATQAWMVFDWDRDAKEGNSHGTDTSREPPFPGPLEVFLIFYNLNPQQPAHEHRPWIYEEGWQLRDDMQVPRVTEKEITPTWRGFAEPDWFTESDQRPMHEVRSKTFAADPGAKFGSPRSCIELKGMASKNLPVLIFIKVGRNQIPDPNSFMDAHEAPFMRSVYFEEAWNFRDQHESLLRYNKPENNWMIGAHDDAVELITDLMTQRFVLQGTEDLEDGRSSASTALQALQGTEPEENNPSVRRIVPEELGRSHDMEFMRTGRLKPFWLRSVGEGFYVEDMDFVQLDAVRYRHFRFVPKRLRNMFPDGKKVPQAGKLSFCLQNKLIWQTGWGNAQERRAVGEIVVSFNQVTAVDEFGLETLGGERRDEDPVLFELYASDAASPPTASGWGEPIFKSTFDYPLDNESELIRIGMKQEGMVWYRSGLSWYRMRGLWFDAFEELLTSLNLRMDRQAAWALWRRFVSFKYPPTVRQSPPGFVLVRDIRDALQQLLREEPFMSDTTFLEFNSVSRLQLEHHFAERFYAKVCDLTSDFLGAHNLVRWADFKEHLHDHILQSKPYVSMPGRREEFSVGGIWFEALYQTVITSMPEVPDRDEVKEHYHAYVNPSSGLLPLDRIYDVIAKLGRPGLKYEAFEEFMRKLGLRINSEELLCAFQLIDIDQDFVLGVNELQCGMSILIRTIVPESVLKLVHLRTTQVLNTTLMALGMLCVVFLFLLLSFDALGSSGADSYTSTGIQSGLAGVAAVGIQAFQLGSFKEDRLNDYVLQKLETFMGIAAQRLAARQQHNKMGAVGADGSHAKAAQQ